MITGSIKGKLLVFSVFFLGIVSGVLMTYAWEKRVSETVIPRDVRSNDRAKAARDVNTFYDYLVLSPEQRVRVKQITEDSRPEFNKLFQQTRPQIAELQRQTREQIRAVLTDEQKKKYDTFYENQRNKRKQPQRSK